jgi:Flp pilus assembly protein TadG
MSTRTRHSTASRRCSGDDGSILAELALITPFMIVLVLGILEFGTAYRERSNLSSALRSAARIEAGTGAGRSADYLALQSFYAQMSQAKNLTVNKVVVFKTTSSTGAPLDPTCFTSSSGSSANACSVYTWSQVTQIGQDSGGTVLSNNFGTSGTTCSGTAWDVNWCPLNRQVQQSDPPDFVGVYASATYNSLTGLLPTTVTMTDQAVYRIDPEVSLN